MQACFSCYIKSRKSGRMKVTKCAAVKVELFGEERTYYVPLDATIGEVMSALKEISATAHFVNHKFTEVSNSEYEAHKLYNS